MKFVLVLLTVFLTQNVLANIKIVCEGFAAASDSEINLEIYHDRSTDLGAFQSVEPVDSQMTKTGQVIHVFDHFYKSREGYDKAYFGGYFWFYESPSFHLSVFIPGMKELKEGEWQATGYVGSYESARRDEYGLFSLTEKVNQCLVTVGRE